MTEEFNMRVAMAKLRASHIAQYLRAKGWQQEECRFEDRIYFVGAIHEGGGRYEMYLPASHEVPRYQTLLQRAIYKLCGVEDREPSEILQDMFTGNADSEPSAGNTEARRFRVRNSSDSPLRLRLTSRDGELQLLSGEAIEVVLQARPDSTIEIERTESSLIIRDS